MDALHFNDGPEPNERCVEVAEWLRHRRRCRHRPRHRHRSRTRQHLLHLDHEHGEAAIPSQSHLRQMRLFRRRFSTQRRCRRRLRLERQ